MYMFEKQKKEQAVSPESQAPKALSPEMAAPSAPSGQTASGGVCAEGEGEIRGSLAMVYSPCQYWRAIYSPAEALDCGTLFEELDKPFSGVCACAEGERE